MKRRFFALLVAISLVLPCSAYAAAGQLYLVSPFLLGAADLASIDLGQLIPSIASWPAVAAQGLELDNTSAAIVLWQTATPADVTFTVGNNASLLPYAGNFLATPPAAGSSSLTVPAADFVSAGGAYYAAALVAAPVAGMPVSPTTPITVSAAVGGTTQASAGLTPVAPPVVLVHGMWGDATSLAELHNYLDQTSPWSSHRELVQAIQYTNFLSFDDAEPSSVLNNQILTLYGSLDDEHIVGGRVDVVAHSMGGLVARHYSGLSAYRGLRDRGQGKFHVIVSIDTPQTGSELAQYLLQHRHDTLQSFASPIAAAIWLTGCGPTLPTVAQCFSMLGERLGPKELKRGAVESLIPGGTPLQQLPPPDIPDAVWRAVSAIVPQVGGFIGESAEEFELQQLIAATWPDPNTSPPTIADILADNRRDDAIVPLSSQTAGAATGQYVTFDGLSHSPAADASLLGAFLSTANVTHSSAVDTLVGCWLGSLGAVSCNASAQVPLAAAAASAKMPKLHPVRRLAVQLPPELQLGTAVPLAVHVSGAGLQRMVLRQRDELGHGAPPQILPIDQRSGDTIYATVTPELFGQVTFSLDALFADGGLASKTVTTAVVLPDRPPAAFRADANAQRIRIGVGKGLEVYDLHPQATYAGNPGPVALDNRVVGYRIVGGNAAVALAPNPDDPSVMQITALAPGRATVEARLGAVSAKLDVTVVRQ